VNRTVDNRESSTTLEPWLDASESKSEHAERHGWHQVHIQFADWDVVLRE